MYNYYNNQNPYYNMPPVIYNNGLKGKTIDNLEVVKGADILMDGSVSYFPMADGSAIATKQLQQDGTSKIIIYRPSEEEKPEKYITEKELKDQMSEFNINDIRDIKDELKNLKRQIRNIKEDIEDKKENRHE